MQSLTIRKIVLDAVISHCRREAPKEACGLLAGTGTIVEKVYEMTNADSSSVTYMMDPKEQFLTMKDIRNTGMKMVAIYHSHPQSPAYPSPRDVALASYPDSAYVIISLLDSEPVVKAFIIDEGRVSAIPITIAD